MSGIRVDRFRVKEQRDEYVYGESRRNPFYARREILYTISLEATCTEEVAFLFQQFVEKVSRQYQGYVPPEPRREPVESRSAQLPPITKEIAEHGKAESYEGVRQLPGNGETNRDE